MVAMLSIQLITWDYETNNLFAESQMPYNINNENIILNYLYIINEYFNN